MLFYNKNNSKHKEDYMTFLKVMDMFMAYTIVMVFSKFIKLLTLPMYSFLHVNHTSLKLF